MHNPVLANLALGSLARLREKNAFVPMSPQVQQQKAQEAQQAEAQAQQPAPGVGGAPASPAPEQAAPQPQAQPAPAQPDPSQQAQAQPQQAAGAVPINQVQSIIRDELEASQNKPKKPSTDERLVALEGIVLRMLEHQGLLPAGTATKPPEPDRMQPVAPMGDQLAAQQAQQGQGMPKAASVIAWASENIDHLLARRNVDLGPPQAGLSSGSAGQASSYDLGSTGNGYMSMADGLAEVPGMPKTAQVNPAINLALNRLRGK